jgi:hypothetical protein
MELKINHPNSSESFFLDINISENDNEIVYKISFTDKRLSASYGTVELKRKPNNFWKFPDKADNFLISLLSETIFQIMNNEI